MRDSLPAYLFVLPWYPASMIGGVNQAVRHLIHYTAEQGRYRALLMICNQPPAASPDIGCEVVVRTLPDPFDERHPFAGPLRFALRLPQVLLGLRRFVRQHDVRVINYAFPAAECLSFVLLRRLGLFSGKLVLALHGDDIRRANETRGWRRRLLRLMFRQADRVVACSEGLRQDLLRFEPACAANSMVIHNGLDLDRFESAAAGPEVLPETLRNATFLLNIGKFERKKGQDLLVRAFERVSGEFPDLLLVLIGAPGPEVEQIRQLVAQSPVSRRMLMLENVPHSHISAYLKAARAFVLPSRREGLPFVILEAGACRTPVIAAAAIGVPEVIFDRETGRLVPVEDVNALVQAIRGVLADGDGSRLLAERLHCLVRGHFNWQRAFQQYMSI